MRRDLHSTVVNGKKREINKIWHLYDIPPTAQVVHALTNCKPVSLASFFHLSVRKDKEKGQNRREIYNLGYIFAHYGKWTSKG